jgi:hypothetical protein
MTRIYPKYDTFAGLNYLQRQRAIERLGRRSPLVYGTDVFVHDPEILSHKITVSNGAILHEVIALISQGAAAGATSGEIGKVDPNLYADGVKLSNGSVASTRPGTATDTAYSTHPYIYRAIRVTGKVITIPIKLPNGDTVTAGTVIYQSGTTWTSITGTPGQTIPLTSPAVWVSLQTTSPALFPSKATALTRTETTETDFSHPDIYVREGKLIYRLVGAGRGPYSPDPSHVVTGTLSYLYDTAANKRYELPLTTQPSPPIDYDGDWVVYRKGISNRFPDVVNDLITTAAGSNAATSNPEALIDYPSFVKANAHSEALGLHFSGSIDDPISILDFVSDYACFFDLLTMRDRGRLGLTPHTTTDTYILGIFTFFNCAELLWHFDPIEQHDYSQIAAATHDGGSLISVIGSPKYSDYASLLLDASMVMQTTDALMGQLKRIYDSANQQSQSVEVFSPLTFQGLRAGDFIICESDYFTDDRTHLGGIIATNDPGVYECALEDSYTSFVLSTGTTNNTLSIDADNRLDSKGRIPYKSGDMMLIAMGADTQLYGIVTDVTSTVADILIKYDLVDYQDDRGTWKTNGNVVDLPKDTIVSIYKIGGLTGMAYVYNNDGLPQLVHCALLAVPDGRNRYATMRVLAKVAEYDSVLNASAIVFVGDAKLWRISSIEPLSQGYAYTSNVQNRATDNVRHHDGYRVRATLYPFAEPKAYTATTKPPKTTTDDQPTVVPPPKSTSDTLDYLTEIATGNEFAAPDGITHIWRPGPITIRLDGTLSVTDRATLDSVIADLQRLTGRTISIVSSPSANIRFHIGPVSGFPALLPQYVPGNLGFFWSAYGANQDIVSGDILVDNSTTNQIERNHLICEELTQLIAGLPNDSYKFSDSIFYQPWTTIQKYSALDEEIIKLMAKPTVTSGMTAAQLRQAVA